MATSTRLSSTLDGEVGQQLQGSGVGDGGGEHGWQQAGCEEKAG